MILSKDKIYRRVFILSSLINLSVWAFLYWQVVPRVEPVVLGYTIYFGISRIGPWFYVFEWPLFGLAVLIVNFVLANIFLKKEKLLSRFLIWSALVIQIFLAIFSFFMVLING